jgi:hypothetical protein
VAPSPLQNMPQPRSGRKMGRASERCALRRKQELMLIDVDIFDADVLMATVTEPPMYIDWQSNRP